MRNNTPLLAECPKNESRYQMVIAAAKRAKRINSIARQKGILPNQVTSIKTNFIKAPTIALAEMKTGVITYVKSRTSSIETKQEQ
ncbi:MAG: DNA-directed RNA polymerase subunit omega [bacterium]